MILPLLLVVSSNQMIIHMFPYPVPQSCFAPFPERISDNIWRKKFSAFSIHSSHPKPQSLCSQSEGGGDHNTIVVCSLLPIILISKINTSKMDQVSTDDNGSFIFSEVIIPIIVFFPFSWSHKPIVMYRHFS